MRSLASLSRHIGYALVVLADMAGEELRMQREEESMPAFLALAAPGAPHLLDARLG